MSPSRPTRVSAASRFSGSSTQRRSADPQRGTGDQDAKTAKATATIQVQRVTGRSWSWLRQRLATARLLVQGASACARSASKCALPTQLDAVARAREPPACDLRRRGSARRRMPGLVAASTTSEGRVSRCGSSAEQGVSLPWCCASPAGTAGRAAGSRSPGERVAAKSGLLVEHVGEHAEHGGVRGVDRSMTLLVPWSTCTSAMMANSATPAPRTPATPNSALNRRRSDQHPRSRTATGCHRRPLAANVHDRQVVDKRAAVARSHAVDDGVEQLVDIDARGRRRPAATTLDEPCSPSRAGGPRSPRSSRR